MTRVTIASVAGLIHIGPKGEGGIYSVITVPLEKFPQFVQGCKEAAHSCIQKGTPGITIGCIIGSQEAILTIKREHVDEFITMLDTELAKLKELKSEEAIAEAERILRGNSQLLTIGGATFKPTP